LDRAAGRLEQGRDGPGGARPPPSSADPSPPPNSCPRTTTA
jgi:hypothetical protein